MSDILTAFAFIKAQCDDPTVGYSQKYRKGEMVGDKKYYDCSSLISAGLTAGGFYSVNPWFTTRTMGTSLESLGFTKFPITAGMQTFDILWVEGHTEMCYSVNPLQAMGARNSSLPFVAQVSVHNTKPSDWTYIYRWTNTPVSGWTARQGALSQSEKEGNAYMMTNNFVQNGFYLQAACALTAYADSQSNINPGIRNPFTDSAGLFMWRPSTLIMDYDTDWTNGDIQCRYIREQMQSLWHTGSIYNYTLHEFIHLDDTELVVRVFSDQFLFISDVDVVIQTALQWYEYFSYSPIPPFIQFPLWLLCAIGKMKTDKEL